ncbi:MAG TPA: DUF3667 domain-containing protein [Pyrinomonadaceae bacterium]
MDASLDPSQPTYTVVCPNCDHAMFGKYCQHCGQKKIDHHEFAVRHFVGHLIHEITHLDSNKIARTFSHLLSRPGLLAREYLAGRKGKYINPIRVYLTVSALYFLFAWGALSNAGGGGVETTAARPNFIQIAKSKGVDPVVLATKTHEKAGRYSAFLRFGSVLLSGFFLTALYFGTGRYYVEHLIFSLYFYSFDFLAKCVVAIFYLSSDYIGTNAYLASRILYYCVAFIYLFFALLRVYPEPWPKTLFKTSVLFGLEVLLFIAVNVTGFMLAVALA